MLGQLRRLSGGTVGAANQNKGLWNSLVLRLALRRAVILVFYYYDAHCRISFERLEPSPQTTPLTRFS